MQTATCGPHGESLYSPLTQPAQLGARARELDAFVESLNDNRYGAPPGDVEGERFFSVSVSQLRGELCAGDR
jgi:hypothetical protein